MIKEAIILAGGLGTRLRSVVNEVPKSMAPINGKPFLEHLLDFLIQKGVESFIFSVGYKSDSIQDHFHTSYQNKSIRYVTEEEPLGTGGAIKKAIAEAKTKQVLVVNGDTLFLTDVQKMYVSHQEKNADVSLALKPMYNFSRYGTVALSDKKEIIQFEEKQTREEGLINGGVYIFNQSIFQNFDLPEKFSIEKDFFEAYASDLKLFGFEEDAYFLDIGIPEDYEKAQHEFNKLSY
jgi:D-glycero-alpha-D-manno-heptose 1-phosphate guanylyltransferase